MQGTNHPWDHTETRGENAVEEDVSDGERGIKTPAEIAEVGDEESVTVALSAARVRGGRETTRRLSDNENGDES